VWLQATFGFFPTSLIAGGFAAVVGFFSLLLLLLPLLRQLGVELSGVDPLCAVVPTGVHNRRGRFGRTNPNTRTPTLAAGSA
jgi:hypothetical protein